MANVRNGNTYYIDTVSSGASTCIESKDIQVVGILYHADTANQHFTLNDLSGTGASAGPIKLKVGNTSAHETVFLDLADCPIRFPNGIWISQLDSGNLTLIISAKG